MPELGAIPDSFLHQPWLWPKSGLAGQYPEPIVDVNAAAREARDKVWASRRQAGFRAQAEQVAVRHASRKDGHGHFVRDGGLKRPRSGDVEESPQLSLNL